VLSVRPLWASLSARSQSLAPGAARRTLRYPDIGATYVVASVPAPVAAGQDRDAGLDALSVRSTDGRVVGLAAAADGRRATDAARQRTARISQSMPVHSRPAHLFKRRRRAGSSMG
jgi:hypothetical protein